MFTRNKVQFGYPKEHEDDKNDENMRNSVLVVLDTFLLRVKINEIFFPHASALRADLPFSRREKRSKRIVVEYTK